MEDHEKQNKLIRRIHVGMTIAAVFIGLYWHCRPGLIMMMIGTYSYT